MPFIDTIVAKIGKESYERIEKEAEKEVALAMQMPLLSQHGQDSYYTPRVLPHELLAECELFERVGLQISPMDLMKILFKCKLLFACKTEKELGQRCGGNFPMPVDSALVVRWPERTDNAETVMKRHLERLGSEIRERILVVRVSSFTSITGDRPQSFFDNLLANTGLPFMCFLHDDLTEEHKKLEVGLISYDKNRAMEFFAAPSFGFKCVGSREYCFWQSSMWLRTFLNLLRIGGYINPGQIDFSINKTEMMPPVFPIFLGEHTSGFYKWDEDKHEAWAKIPDGSLFRSFGFRGLSKAWFDRRNLAKLEIFMQNQKIIFESLKNPWNAKNLNDIAPTLDILSTATQMPDVGAKILLIYCCLEHLFVPKNTKSDNKKYIVGGLNALAPHLLTWFNQLYDLRCDYAHKGFVQRENSTMGLIMTSMKNALDLLRAKLSVS